MNFLSLSRSLLWKNEIPTSSQDNKKENPSTKNLQKIAKFSYSLKKKKKNSCSTFHQFIQSPSLDLIMYYIYKHIAIIYLHLLRGTFIFLYIKHTATTRQNIHASQSAYRRTPPKKKKKCDYFAGYFSLTSHSHIIPSLFYCMREHRAIQFIFTCEQKYFWRNKFNYDIRFGAIVSNFQPLLYIVYIIYMLVYIGIIYFFIFHLHQRYASRVRRDSITLSYL